MDRRLAAYAAAAVAGMAGIAGASPVVTTFNADVGADGYTDLDINGLASGRECSIANNADGVWMKNNAAGVQYASASATANTIAPVTAAQVDSSLTFAAATDNVYLINGKSSTAAFAEDGSTQYLGFRLANGSGGDYNYGVLSLSITPYTNASSQKDWTTHLNYMVYESAVNTPVSVAVPEPAALGVLALGAAAMLRRRNA